MKTLDELGLQIHFYLGQNLDYQPILIADLVSESQVYRVYRDVAEVSVTVSYVLAHRLELEKFEHCWLAHSNLSEAAYLAFPHSYVEKKVATATDPLSATLVANAYGSAIETVVEDFEKKWGIAPIVEDPQASHGLDSLYNAWLTDRSGPLFTAEEAQHG